MLTEKEERQIRERMRVKYNHDDEYINEYIDRVKATRQRNADKKEQPVIAINIDKLIAGKATEDRAKLLHDGIAWDASFLDVSIARDVEVDPDQPVFEGCVNKRPVPGYHYLTLRFKVLRND